MDWTLMRAVVISLPRHTHRLQAFRRRWAALGLDIDVHEFAAVEHRDGAMGCYASHVAALAQHHEPVLVMEDDVLFRAGFTPHIEPPTPAQLIWLGGQHMLPPQPVAPGWVRPTSIARTHAYLANDPQLLARLLHPQRQRHVDHALSALPVTQLAAHPFLAGQAAGVSSIDGANHVRSRFWNQ